MLLRKVDFDDLSDIHFALVKAARVNYFTLDMSAHKNMVEAKGVSRGIRAL